MAIGSTWSTVSQGSLLTAPDGGWMESRVQWRRPNANLFEFRLQIRVNRAAIMNHLRIWFSVNGVANVTGGAPATLNWNPNPPATSGWLNVGPVWTRTAAQAGNAYQITNLRCEIQFQRAGQPVWFGGRNIGNGQWWVARSGGNINLGVPDAVTWNNGTLGNVQWNNGSLGTVRWIR